MHKHIVRWVVPAAVIGLSIAASLSVKASDSRPWISSPLSIQKQADSQSLPSSLNGNIDCYMDDLYSCSIPTAYGAATQNGAARLYGTDGYKPVISYVDGQQHFLPIPNSNKVISYSGGPTYGLYFYFTDNFSSSISKALYVNGVDTEYRINRPPDGKLADRAGHYLPADYESLSFSKNGDWMVVSEPNLAMLRVNLNTFEVLPFAPGFDYRIGLAPAVKTAISNDGRYAVVASRNFNSFTIYDLSTCGPIPDVIRGSVTCQFRDLGRFMQQQVSGYNSVASVRFLDNDTLAIYAAYRSGSANKTARFTLSDSDIIPGLQYLALGDSYISGEGAFDYQGGTDTSDNHCHLSYLAYPYLIGRQLGYDSYNSVACSGAVMDDLTNSTGRYKGQADDRKIARSRRRQEFIETVISSFSPGYIDQMDFVGAYQPQVVTLSIGGNDMGFSKILLSCVEAGTCFTTYEDRLELASQINQQVFPKLVSTYQQIRHAGPPAMKVYVVGYPQIADPEGDCALNVHLNHDELVFSQQVIGYLDDVISAAASKAGVFYVDTQNALAGHRLCEAGPGQVAMNGLTAGNDRPTSIGGPIGNESYHPNRLGYQLLEESVLDATDSFNAQMPSPDLSSAPPSVTDLAVMDMAHSGRLVNNSQYDDNLADDLVYKQNSIDIAVAGNQHALKPSSTYGVVLHSSPLSLGNISSDSAGNITASIKLPLDVTTGYHALHLYGLDILGRPIDIYKTIYVAASPDDMDGDGITDSADSCMMVEPSLQDYDQDGVDDSCDGTIDSAPVNSPSNKEVVIVSDSGGTVATNAIELIQNAPARDVEVSLSAAPLVLSDMSTSPDEVLLAKDSGNYPSHISSSDSPLLLAVVFTILAAAASLALRRIF